MKSSYTQTLTQNHFQETRRLSIFNKKAGFTKRAAVLILTGQQEIPKKYFYKGITYLLTSLYCAISSI